MLLVDSDRKHLNWLSRVMRTLVHRAEPRGTLGDLDELDAFDLMAVNYDGLDPSEQKRLLEAFGGGRQTVPLLLFARGRGHEELAPLFEGHAITNLLAKNENVDAEELIVTVQKILRRQIFGIEKYFVWGVETVATTVRTSADKERILGWAEAYAANLEVMPRLVAQYCTVVDEFLTNAVYNAPVDPNGNHRFARASRTTEVRLEPHEAVEIKLCCDGRRLGVSAVDPFGSLSRDLILDYLAKCFRKREDQIDQKAGGAGLGLYLLFDALSQFVVNISPGRRTEMIGLIDVRGSYKDFAGRGKSFNVFSATDSIDSPQS